MSQKEVKAGSSQGPTAPQKKKKHPTPFAVKPLGALYVFLAANLLAAAFAPIQDCDETFNYWEPTHYLSHGYGLQTWEYSPEYAIRSWTYICFHAFIGSLRRLLPFPTKVKEFYFIRYVLAFICAICQTVMFRVINGTLNPRIAIFFMMALIFSPGMFHASASYLPSSFAMYTTMLGTAAFVNWKGGLRTAQGIFWFAVGGVLGWPFAIALSAPYLLEELVFASLSDRNAFIETIGRFLRGGIAGLLVLLLEISISSFFFKKLTIVPLNIILYNIFSGPTKGPEIFGTSPWHFYIQNLLLNFNLWFILAISALPLFTMQKLLSRSSPEGGGAITGLRTVVFMSPFYLWLGIFSLQPHKEERFMYPAYPALALNAAMSLHILLAAFGHSDPKTLFGKIPARLKLLIVSIFVIGSIDIGIARIYGIYSAYSAPLKIYEVLQTGQYGNPGDFVCFGKDWYRFPSSYHLPNGIKAKFIKSEFRGLLPGEFAEGIGLRAGTSVIPSGMNDENTEDTSKYTDIQKCNFLVDKYYPSSTASELEPHYELEDNWGWLECKPFLDAGRTGLLGRLTWLPDLPFVPEGWRRRWGRLCLLKWVGEGIPEEGAEGRL